MDTTNAELRKKVVWVTCQTLLLHQRAPETRIASALSAVEILTVLSYGGILNSSPSNRGDPSRNRLIVSKGHGGIPLYPILADFGFFDKKELLRIGKPDSFLGSIPDTGIPGIETTNGSLGHGLGVACGIALACRMRGYANRIYIICGDGELNEGAVWEAVMFAAHHRLSNLTLIIDDNGLSMLGSQQDILGLRPLDKKFEVFGWAATNVDGHNVEELHRELHRMAVEASPCPRVLVARTRKGNGISEMETDPLCHVRSLSPKRIQQRLEELK